MRREGAEVMGMRERSDRGIGSGSLFSRSYHFIFHHLSLSISLSFSLSLSLSSTLQSMICSVFVLSLSPTHSLSHSPFPLSVHSRSPRITIQLLASLSPSLFLSHSFFIFLFPFFLPSVLSLASSFIKQEAKSSSLPFLLTFF